MAKAEPRPSLPPSSTALFLFGAGAVAILCVLSEKRRKKALRVMDLMLSADGPVQKVSVLRGREVAAAVEESLREARAWWNTFKPLIRAEAERHAEQD